MYFVRIDLDLLDEEERNLLEDIRKNHFERVPWSIFLIEVLENYANIYNHLFIDTEDIDNI